MICQEVLKILNSVFETRLYLFSERRDNSIVLSSKLLLYDVVVSDHSIGENGLNGGKSGGYIGNSGAKCSVAISDSSLKGCLCVCKLLISSCSYSIGSILDSLLEVSLSGCKIALYGVDRCTKSLLSSSKCSVELCNCSVESSSINSVAAGDNALQLLLSFCKICSSCISRRLDGAFEVSNCITYSAFLLSIVLYDLRFEVIGLTTNHKAERNDHQACKQNGQNVSFHDFLSFH